MSYNVPMVMGKVSWLSLVFQLVIIGLIFYLFKVLGFVEPFLFAALTYAIVARVLRSIIARKHRRGIKLVKQKKYNEAIRPFEESFNYFTKNSWVDKYRFLTLLSSTGYSYSQMALDNIAFCYGQAGNKLKALEYYKKALQSNPRDGLAQAGLNMLQAQ